MGLAEISALTENFCRNKKDLYVKWVCDQDYKKKIATWMKKWIVSRLLEVPMTYKQKLICTRLGIYVCVMSNNV